MLEIKCEHAFVCKEVELTICEFRVDWDVHALLEQVKACVCILGRR